jgi:hypothetical protein
MSQGHVNKRRGITRACGLAMLVLIVATPGVWSAQVTIKERKYFNSLERKNLDSLERNSINSNKNIVVEEWKVIAPNYSNIDVGKILDDMGNKTYTELFVIKTADDEMVCEVTKCYGLDAKTITKLADSVLSAREKEEQLRSAKVNSYISISSAIVSVISLLISASSAIRTLRTKKTDASV